jgi:hypothetical protein
MMKTAIAAAAAMFTVAANAQTLDCAALSNSSQAEPAGYAAQCGTLVAANPSVSSNRAPTDTGVTIDIRGNAPRLANTLYSFTLNAFQTQTSLGATNPSVFGTDFSANGQTLYGVVGTGAATNALSLGTINRTTGAFTAIGALTGLAAGENVTALAIHPRTNAAWIVGNGGTPAFSNLYTLNLTTGAVTLVGPMNPGATVPNIHIAIAVNCNGDMYSHNVADDSLYRVNTTTGLSTVIGTHGLAANFAQGMDFDNNDGSLYGFIYTGAGTNRFGTFNLATGAFTSLTTDNPLGEYEGAIPTQCPTTGPAPAITPVTPAGALTNQQGSTTLSFSNATGAMVGPGTVSCALSSVVGAVTIAPTTAITVAPGSTGSFTVTSGGAPGTTYSATATCTIQGAAAPVVYTILGAVANARVQAPTLNLLGISVLGLFMLGLGGWTARRR